MTYDSNNGNLFVVHKPDGGHPRKFHQSNQGLFYMDTSSDDGNVLITTDDKSCITESTTLVNTVDDNKNKYSQREYSQALVARKLQQTVGRPSTRTFMSLVDRNVIPNCPITRKDIVNAKLILGPDLGSLKGKTTCKTSTRVDGEYSAVSPEILERHSALTICGDDIMFVAFFVTISRGIKFGTVEMIGDQNSKTILTAITQQVRNVYAKRGFPLTHILMDGQFDHLRNDLNGMGIHFNGVARNEHVPEVERYIRTLKERARSTIVTLPFERIPNRMTIELMYAYNFWINCFPANDGASDTISPRELVTGLKVTYD